MRPAMLVCALLVGCVLPPVVEPPPLPPSDAGACDAAIGIDDCGRAQLRVHCELACPGYEGSSGLDRAWGTGDDETFAEVCRLFETGDSRFSLQPECLAVAASCSSADACAE